jgi:hypothetical protein
MTEKRTATEFWGCQTYYLVAGNINTTLRIYLEFILLKPIAALSQTV